MTTEMTQNDLEPPRRLRLLEDGEPVDLTGKTVRYLARQVGKANPKQITADATFPDQSVASNRGVVIYAWVSGDTDTPGRYEEAVEVSDGANRPRTFRRKGVTLLIASDLE